MCTAITYQTKDHYFGRNLDYEITFGERVVLTPRKFPLTYKCAKDTCDSHYAILGMALVADGYPLYFDAVNEKGLGIAGLRFVGNAHYAERSEEKYNIAPYELIPWILGKCETVEQAKDLLLQTRVVAVPFNSRLPLSPLHFMIADKKRAIVVEPVKEGMKIYDNPVGVLTNNPPFPFHLANLNNYINLTAKPPVNRFSPEIPLESYSRGMGALGLPGDMSSASRFVRAAFVRANSVSGCGENESVHQFFHILGSVEQVRGTVRLESGAYEITTYTSCCNLDRGIYYYRTYENSRIRAVSMEDGNPDGKELRVWKVD